MYSTGLDSKDFQFCKPLHVAAVVVAFPNWIITTKKKNIFRVLKKGESTIDH